MELHNLPSPYFSNGIVREVNNLRSLSVSVNAGGNGMTRQDISENSPIVVRFLHAKKDLIIAFTIIAIAAYGFELFNFNLTIDEELYAIGAMSPINWLREGRWGMYLLQVFVLPNPIVPFVPLGLALLFHILSIFLLLDAWEIKSFWIQLLAGSLMLTYPGWAYVYVFSSLNYGVGIGLFMAASSLWIYKNIENSSYKLLAVLPATFAFALYQAMLPTFLLLFITYFALNIVRKSAVTILNLFHFFLITTLAGLTYYITQQVFTTIINIQSTGYVETHFITISDIVNLNLNLDAGAEIVSLYGGSASIYTLTMFSLPLLIFVLLLATMLKNAQQLSLWDKTLALTLSILILVVPVLPTLFLQVVKLRFLIGIPFSIATLLIIGIENCKGQVLRWLISVLAVLTILQFIISINQLFGATHISLQSDRILAGRIIERIEMVRNQSPKPDEVKYIEVIGSFQKTPTLINPSPYRYEIIGKSFFEFNGGVSRRIVAFLNTLDYAELSPLPIDRRANFILISERMPAWPKVGSVQVVNDTVLVKFGPYSEVQIKQICNFGKPVLVENFCP